MDNRRPANRYVLVARTPDAGATGGMVRRYSLARVGVNRRSALGEDRHLRLERAARSGPGPGPH